MDRKTLLIAAIVAVGGFGLCGGRPAVAEGVTPDLPTPRRGMTMNQVAVKFGDPASKLPAVGNPPISRWEYRGFVVYFEHQHVIHSVIANS
ncbi:MAG: hypothetical protein M3O06_09395 [Pseudomonadota bacterium]|nr:hypothetical protein [Pseudomonadota bacterium]